MFRPVIVGMRGQQYGRMATVMHDTSTPPVAAYLSSLGLKRLPRHHRILEQSLDLMLESGTLVVKLVL